ncbi:MAG TPA: class I SAM-dependent methyltransferase [Streptosporangiaceae bacterium]
MSGSEAGSAAGLAGQDADAGLTELLVRWRADLESWAIPDHILAATSESPWVLPGQVFARRADKLTAEPAGPSFERAWDALDPPGSVLDVGSGPGAACLPLLPRTTALTAVDADERMLDLLAERTSTGRVPATCVVGRWPQVAPEVAAADVVTCHHVLYNAPDLEPFLAALTDHARRQVVVEIAASHPLTSLNELWLRFHGLRRPDRPAADDVLAILQAMGVPARHQIWKRPGGADYASFAELTDVTRRRLCLPPQRAGDVADALIDAGVDPEHPQDLGSSGRDVMTIWWAGRAEK